MQAISKRTLQKYNRKYGNRAKREHSGRMGEVRQHGFDSRISLLMSAHNAWQSLDTWRKDIRRNEEFVFGDQHSDLVYDAHTCRVMTERDYFKKQGLNPSQYNIIRNVVRTVTGVWGSNKTLPNCVAQKEGSQPESDILTATLHAMYRKNDMWKLDLAELTQLMITGVAVSKNHYTHRNGSSDVVNDYVNPFTFFVDNNMKDPRYKDCSLVGCFHDITVDDAVGMFAHGSKERGERIRSLFYGTNERERVLNHVETFTDKRLDADFFTPAMEAEGLVRVIEVWRKESGECYRIHDRLTGDYYSDFESSEKDLEQENIRRLTEQLAMGVAEEDVKLLEYTWETDTYWKYYYLTPYGSVLDEGISPFWHDENPFVFEFHEFFVGKIYPFVKDLIDANKQINKLSALSELLTMNSAKSLLLMPRQMVEDMDGGVEEVERKLTRPDAVITYDGKSNLDKPQYINTVAQSFTPLNVVNMYLKLSEQVSGVYGALQGSQAVSGTPAAMYAQQSQNSATSLNGLFECINSYRRRRDKMNVQLMQQFYEDKRYIYDKENGKEIVFERDKVKNIDFEIAISENTNTPAYRLMINDILFQLKQFDVENKIDLRGLVEIGNLPFKDKLLDYLNERENQLQQGVPADGMPADLQNEMGQYQFDPALTNNIME